MRAFVIDGPGRSVGRRGRRHRGPRPARSWSTSPGSGCAAPTPSSSAARWPTSAQGHAALSDPDRPRVVRHGGRGRGGRRPGLARPAGDRRHDDRLRDLPALPERPPARLRRAARDRDPGRLPGRAGRAAGRPGRAPCMACPTRSTTSPGRWSSRAATRSGRSRRPGCAPGDRLLVLGAGTIGLLAALIARARGAEVHLVGRSRTFARLRGRRSASPTPARSTQIPDLAWDAVIDASTDPRLPALAARPGRARQADRVHRPGRDAQRDRHADARPQGRHRGRDPERLGRPGRHDRAVRERRGRSRGRSSRRPSASSRSATSWPDGGPPSAGPGPKIHVDPRL